MSAIRITPADWRRMSWKNGGGETMEIAAAYPEGQPGGFTGGGFLWRLSLADVRADGPFSRFPGIDRTILVAEGAGMELTFTAASDTAPRTVRLAERFRPLLFSGDWDTHCRLLDGPIRDFNLMVDRARATAETTVLHGNGPWPVPDADLLLLHVFAGTVTAAGLMLAPGDALRATPGEMGAIRGGSAETVAVLVALSWC